jgi:Flp pilus assembly protein TadD
MRTRGYLSVFVALFLVAGTLTPCVAEGHSTAADGDSVTYAVSAGGDAQPSKPKGNGFARAITAPFRALGRLFGGGKKKNSEEAKKPAPKTEAATKELAAAVVTATTAPPAALVTEVEKPKKEDKRKEEKKRKAAANEPALVAEQKPAPDARSASQSESVRIVRPGEGQPTPQAASVPPRWVPVIEGIGKDPLTQGRALLQHGYLNEAISELSIASTVGPDLVEANNLLGLAYDRIGAHAQAIEAYERALSAAPGSPQVMNNLGYSLHLAGRNADALKRLKQAERLAPGTPYVLQNIALVQARTGKYGDAFKTYARALGEYEARVKTAELLEQAGRSDDAIKHYKAALKIQPDSAALVERLADLYDRIGRQREAEAARRTRGTQPNKQKTATGGGGGG